MKNRTHYLHFSENHIEKASKLTIGQAVKDSINFVGHPGILSLYIWDPPVERPELGDGIPKISEESEFVKQSYNSSSRNNS